MKSSAQVNGHLSFALGLIIIRRSPVGQQVMAMCPRKHVLEKFNVVEKEDDGMYYFCDYCFVIIKETAYGCKGCPSDFCLCRSCYDRPSSFQRFVCKTGPSVPNKDELCKTGPTVPKGWAAKDEFAWKPDRWVYCIERQEWHPNVRR